MATINSFGGGKANVSGIVASLPDKGMWKNVVGMGMILQQYSISAATAIMHDGKQAIMSDPSMTPIQRVQARKAFAIRFGTQFALAGALGVPFAAAVLKALEETTGENIEQDIRQGIASLAGDDKQLGAMISDLAMRGMPNHVLGVDIGRKFALSNIMGVGQKEGFQLEDLFGPLPGAMENAGKAMLALRYGEPGQAVRDLVPPYLKNTIEMIDSQRKYGQVQFMDKTNNLLMVPGKMEALTYALGAVPERLAQMKEVQNQIMTSGQFAKTLNDKNADHAAMALVQGNTSKLHDYVENLRQQDPSIDPQELTRSVIDRATDMMTPKDFMAMKTPLGQRAQNRIITTSFPGPFNRQSEMQRLQIRDNATAALGYPYGMQPASGSEYQKAAMIDSLTEGGLSKAEAARQVELMTSNTALGRTLMPTL